MLERLPLMRGTPLGLLEPPAVRYDGAMRAAVGFRLALLTALLLIISSRTQAQDDFFGADKGLHFGLSAAAAFTSYVVLDGLELNTGVHYSLSILLPLALGVGKELLDIANGGRASGADLAWDLMGVITGFAIGYVLRTWLFPRTAPEPLLLFGEVAAERQ